MFIQGVSQTFQSSSKRVRFFSPLIALVRGTVKNARNISEAFVTFADSSLIELV